MTKNTTTYQIQGIDKTLWRQFRGKAMCEGFNNASACLIKLIDLYSKGEISADK